VLKGAFLAAMRPRQSCRQLPVFVLSGTVPAGRWLQGVLRTT